MRKEKGKVNTASQAQRKEHLQMQVLFLAAEEGFEPSQTESESVVLTVTLFGNIHFQRRLSYHIIPGLSREKT